MSESMERVLHIIASIAVYEKHGLVRAVTYLRDVGGFTTNEAIDVMAKYEDAQDQVRKGMLP